MRTSEWVLLAYLGYLALSACVRPLKRRLPLMLAIAATAVLVIAATRLPSGLPGRALRDLAPLPFIFVCYQLSGRLFLEPQPAVEAAFAVFDARVQRLLGMPASLARAPRLLLEYLEAAYFLCYPALPAGCLALLARGRPDAVDRYWTFVLAATLGSYGVLPWIRTRAPWELEPPGPMDQRPVWFRSLNRLVNRNASIRVNTFPSAHTAGTLAVGLAVVGVWPAMGAALVLLGLSIGVSTVTGRYHYAGDSVAAIAETLLAWAILAVVWP